MERRQCRQCGEEIGRGLNGKRVFCSRYCAGAAYRAKRRLSRQLPAGTRDEALADLAGGCLGALEALCRAVSEGHCSVEVREAAAVARREVGELAARAEGLMPGVCKGKESRAS